LKERIQVTDAGAGTCLPRDGFDLGSVIGDVGRGAAVRIRSSSPRTWT
jgi:hypothetical protein